MYLHNVFMILNRASSSIVKLTLQLTAAQLGSNEMLAQSCRASKSLFAEDALRWTFAVFGYNRRCWRDALGVTAVRQFARNSFAGLRQEKREVREGRRYTGYRNGVIKTSRKAWELNWSHLYFLKAFIILTKKQFRKKWRKIKAKIKIKWRGKHVKKL